MTCVCSSMCACVCLRGRGGGLPKEAQRSVHRTATYSHALTASGIAQTPALALHRQPQRRKHTLTHAAHPCPHPQAELGDEWQIFLLEDKDEKPTAVVLPATAREGEVSRFTEVRRGPVMPRRLASCRAKGEAVCGPSPSDAARGGQLHAQERRCVR